MQSYTSNLLIIIISGTTPAAAGFDGSCGAQISDVTMFEGVGVGGSDKHLTIFKVILLGRGG